MAGKFDPRSQDDVLRVVTENPFGWIVSGAGRDNRATALPFRPVTGPDGSIVRILGHFARSNPQVEALRADPRALVLILGPHGYISPSWMSDRTQAPTWNYASAQFNVEATLVEDPDALKAIVRDLVGAMEDGRPQAWSVDDMGERYDRLARGIVGFDARVVETRGKFKLGQDERDDVFAEISDRLVAEGQHDLARWMVDFDQR